MAMKLGFRQFEYDDSAPLYIDTFGGARVFNRITRKTLDKASLLAVMAKEGYTPASGEIGPAPASWATNHLIPGSSATPVVTGAPITVAVTKAPTTTADDTGKITVAGGPADKAYTVNVLIKDASSAGDDVQNVAIAKGDTAIQAATAIAVAISDPNVKVNRSYAVLTITPKAGSFIEKLQVSIS